MNATPTRFVFDLAETPDWRADQVPARRMLIWATLTLWLANFLILTAKSFADQPDRWAMLIGPRLLLVGIGIAICFAVHAILARAGRHSFRRQLIAAAILAPLAAEVYGWANAIVAQWLLGATLAASRGEAILQLSLHLWFFATWIGFYLAIAYSARLRLQEQREAAAQIFAQTAQLQALHYQISPHFLFNTLNSISALIVDRRNSDAETMVQRLADFLRTTLDLDPQDDVSLERELALQRAYLNIERVRFPDLILDIRIAPDARGAMVPSLILQPLVENAVKHGVAASLGSSTISIVAALASGQLELEISNRTSARSGGQGGGIGLRNVRDRLAARCGGSASLETRFERPDLFVATLRMPLVPA